MPLKMGDVQTISSDEEDESCPDRPYATPGWFQPNILHDVSKSSLAAKNHDYTQDSTQDSTQDDTQVQNNRCRAFNDFTRSTSESRKRERPSDQDSSSAFRKRPNINPFMGPELQPFPNVQQGNQNLPVNNANSGFSVISQADPEGPSHMDRRRNSGSELQPFPNVQHGNQNLPANNANSGFSVISQADPEGPTHMDRRKNSYPEPARHSPFHFFLRNNNICRSPEQESNLPVEFDVKSPVFNTRRRPSQLSEPVEVSSSDESEDSFIWTSSQMVAPPKSFNELKKSKTPDVILSDDDDDAIAPTQLSPRSAKKDSGRFTDPFNGRIATGLDLDYRDHDQTISVIGNCSSESESESPILKKAPKNFRRLNSDDADFQKSVPSDFPQMGDPTAAAPCNVFPAPQRGTHSFKIPVIVPDCYDKSHTSCRNFNVNITPPVIVADCDDKAHTSCRNFNVNITPLSSCTSQAAATRSDCVRVPSPQPSSDVLSECKVVLKDAINYRISDSCGEVNCSCNVGNLTNEKRQAAETEPRSDRQPAIDQMLPVVAGSGNRFRRWSVSWDHSNSESQSVLGDPVTDQNLSRPLNVTPVAQPMTSYSHNAPVTPVAQLTTGIQSTVTDKSGVYVTIQRLSEQVDRVRKTSTGDLFSDDDLFDDYTLTQCDEAATKAYQVNKNASEFKKPFDIAVKDDPVKMPPHLLKIDCQGEFRGHGVVAVESTQSPPMLSPQPHLYSQQDDCIILSDSDDEIFANLTQAVMNPMAIRDSDDETVDDGWNDDDDDIDATMMMVDESCFVVPPDENVVRVEPKAEYVMRFEPKAEHVVRVEPKTENRIVEEMDYGVRSEFCERERLRQMSSGVNVEDVRSYREVEPVEVEPEEVEYVPRCHPISVMKEENSRRCRDRNFALDDVISYREVAPEPEEVEYEPQHHQLSIIKEEEDIRESRDCNSALKSAAQKAVVPASSYAKPPQFAFIRSPETAEVCGEARRVVGTIAERTSDPEDDDVPIGELIEKQKVLVKKNLKKYTEVKPVPVRMHSAASGRMEKKFAFDAGAESDESETNLPRFDMNRGCLLLPKDINIRPPQEILEVEIDEEPAPVHVDTRSHDPREGHNVEPVKPAEFLLKLESDVEDEENYEMYLKDDETKVTKVNYLKCDELEKSELVLQYYNFTERDQWMSKTSPVKPRVHSNVVSPRKRRPAERKKKQTKSKVLPEKRKKRSTSEDQGHKIAQLRESHTLLKKKVPKASLDNKCCEQGSKIDQSIKNARNVMKERARQVERENKEKVASGETSRREKQPAKVVSRRKTHPATEKVGVCSVARPAPSREKRVSVEEVSTSRAGVSVLDAILGPAADRGSVPAGKLESAGIRKNDAKRLETAAHNHTLKKHSNVTDKISERSGAEFLGVFKRPACRSVRPNEKNTGFKIPRLSNKETDMTPAVTLAPNTSLTVSISIKDLGGASSSSLVALEPGSKDARVKQVEVSTARKKDTSKEINAEATSERSNVLKRKLDGIVSERRSDSVSSRAGIEAKKSSANTLNSTESPLQLPGSSKHSTSKSATPIASESSLSNSSRGIPVSPSTAVPPKSSSDNSKSSRSGTSKSSTHIASKSLPDTSKSSSSISSKSLVSDSSSKPQKSHDTSHALPSRSKKDEPHKTKSSSASIANSGKLKADRETSTSRSNKKSSETSSDRYKRAKESDKHGLKNDRVSSMVSNDPNAARKSRSENSRVAEAVDNRQVAVLADVGKSSMLETEKLGDNSVAATSVQENCTLPDKQGNVAADATASDIVGQTTEVFLGQQLSGSDKRVVQRLDRTKPPKEKQNSVVAGTTAADVAGQTSKVQLGQPLSGSEKHIMRPPDRTRTTSENQSKIKDKLLDNKQISRKKPAENQPEMVRRVNELVENQLETVNKKTRDKLLDNKQISRKKPVESQPDVVPPVSKLVENQLETVHKITRDKLLDNEQIRKKPAENQPDVVPPAESQPDVVPPANELVENQLETMNKPTENLGGNTTEAKQTGSGVVRPIPELPCPSAFVEPAAPPAMVRPLSERDPRRRTREVVRTSAPALGREMESITLSQIVNDSIRKTGPMPSPLLSEVAPKKRVQPDVGPSNRPTEKECRNMTDFPRAKVDVTAVLPKDSLTSIILYWNPVWMKECETVKVPPPIVNYDKVYPLLDTYDSFADYASILQPLMLLELWESMIKDWKEGQRGNKPKSSKVIATYLRIEKEQRRMFLHCQGVLSQQENATGRFLRESDLVIVNLPVPPKGQAPDPSSTVIKPVFGIVSKVNKQIQGKTQEPLQPKIEELKKSIAERCFIITYIIELTYRKQPIDNSEFISVELVTSILSTLRQFSGLANLPRSTLAAEILRPFHREVFHHNMEIGANQLKERFNPSQRDAISKIAKAVLDPYFPPKICLLQGPPGTGKSHTVIGLVEHLLAQNSNFHILLCAPSNAGIDELCRRLIACNRLERPGSRKGISFVRLGVMSSIHSDIVPYSLQIQAKKKYEQQQKSAPTSVQSTLMNLEQKQKEWKAKLDKCLKENNTNEVEIARKELKMLEKRKESISGGLSKPMSAAEEVRMKKEVLMGVDVVCTTLNHSGSQHIVDMMYHQDATKHHFGCVIVDEACQCTEVDCLIPLQYRSSKLVLVGDPEQLPPTVLSKKAGDMSYGQSLFERLYNQLKPSPTSNQTTPVLMLQTQYRMHKEICHFSSKHFYSNLLETDPNTAKKRSQFRSSAYSVFDLQYTYEKSDQRGVSINNPEEADFIVQLCQHLASWMTPEKAVENIGIITPYQSQRMYIVELLKKRCWELSAIEVGTVDGFQGREKDVIIVSCVRANSSRNIGFLADRRRMNVSLTRAKYALYVIGHMKTLTSNSDWSALVTDAQHRGRLVKVPTGQQSVSQIQHGCSKS